MNENDVPWLALRRKALACGIDDGAFWRMSPAAMIAITAGMNRTEKRGRQMAAGKGGAEPLPYRSAGGLCDCV